MQLFGGRFDSDVRINYDNFWNAYVSVFSILTGENWNEAMYNGINSYDSIAVFKMLLGTSLILLVSRRYGGVQKDGGWASLYFLSLVICGNYVVLNIFLAIAVESLETVQVRLNSWSRVFLFSRLYLPLTGSSGDAWVGLRRGRGW